MKRRTRSPAGDSRSKIRIRPIYFLMVPIAISFIGISTGSFRLQNDEREEGEISASSTESTARTMAAFPPQKNGSSRKPLLLFHVGPPKTATTTTQATFTMFESLLNRDNYAYVGQVNRGNGMPANHSFTQRALVCDCHREMSDYLLSQGNRSRHERMEEEPLCWRRMRAELDRIHSQGKNVIISEEMISFLWADYPARDRGYSHCGKVGMEPLYELFKDKWNVKVLVGYRRYYKWLESSLHQLLKHARGKPRYDNWPKAGGPRRPPLFRALQDLFKKEDESYPYPYTNQVVKSFAKYYDVLIINMDKKPDVPVQLLCDFLPDAKEACEEVSKEEEKEPFVKNAAESLNYDIDILATEASRRNLFDTKALSRPFVRSAIRNFHEKQLGLSRTDFPLVCPSKEELMPFLEKSLQYEKECVPDFYASPDGEAAHRSRFWKDVEAKKFCSVDHDAVLSDEKWIRFLRSLNKKF